MALLDLLGRRMTLRVLWELALAEEPLTFRALQAAAATNPGVLNSRLKELRAAAVVGRSDTGYHLSPDGRALVELVLPLRDWADAWAARLAPSVTTAVAETTNLSAQRPRRRRSSSVG
jgi:DNA-binding HxlR family transcriptional regulator